MTPENFCYWLQGLFEVGNPTELSKEQLDVVKEHLQLVFKKVTHHKLGEAPNKVVDRKEIDDYIKKIKSGVIYTKEHDPYDLENIPHCSVAFPPNGEMVDLNTGKTVPIHEVIMWPEGSC
jgi:hypothetical protein